MLDTLLDIELDQHASYFQPIDLFSTHGYEHITKIYPRFSHFTIDAMIESDMFYNVKNGEYLKKLVEYRDYLMRTNVMLNQVEQELIAIRYSNYSDKEKIRMSKEIQTANRECELLKRIKLSIIEIFVSGIQNFEIVIKDEEGKRILEEVKRTGGANIEPL